MSATTLTSSLSLEEKVKIFPGHMKGVRQPSIIFSVLLNEALAGDLPSGSLVRDASIWIQKKTNSFSGDIAPADSTFMGLFLQSIQNLLEFHHHPVFSTGKVLHQQAGNGVTKVQIQQPCLDFNAAIAAVSLCVEFYKAAIENAEKYQSLKTNFTKAFAPGLARVSSGRLVGFNMIHFLKAAHDLHIPWFRFSGHTFQFGHGEKARLLNSSFTDRTGIVSATIARDKVAASGLLRQAGLPVMDHFRVSSPTEAVTFAQRLGFPVVVKPSDQDGGAGVAAFLMTSDEVTKAYESASKISKQVIVEKFFTGKDYRIQIVNGVVQGVLERSPGGVVGDGARKISELVAQQNNDRKKAVDDRRFLHPIPLDDECLRMMAIQGLTFDSIPPAGAFVRLRGAANVASGGVPSVVDLASVHPDNLELARKAARVMRLDVAGVDLLIPDIRVSWIETGAAICEVNGQPQMFTTFHRPMLESLLGPHLGRIPIILVVERQGGDYEFSRELATEFSKDRGDIGFVSPNRVLIDDAATGIKAGDIFSSVRALLIDPKLRALVLAIPVGFEAIKGWPVPSIDLLIVADSNTDTESKKEEFETALSFLVDTLDSLNSDLISVQDTLADGLRRLDRPGLGRLLRLPNSPVEAAMFIRENLPQIC